MRAIRQCRYRSAGMRHSDDHVASDRDRDSMKPHSEAMCLSLSLLVGRRGMEINDRCRQIGLRIISQLGMNQAKKVLPAIGLVHLPFLAAFISAKSAGLMPFFLHFFNSSGVSAPMSCELAVQVLLDRELPVSEFGYREGVPDETVLDALDELERYDV